MTTLNLCPSAIASSGSFRRKGRAKLFRSALSVLFTAGFALSLASCKKPEPEAPKVIEVSSSSRPIVSQGLSVDGAVTVSETFAFTAPDSWTASVTDTKASAWVTVKMRVIPAEYIALNTTALNMKVGETETLQATVYPLESTDKVITWTSDYPNVATVDANGTVTAVGSGSTSVTARCGAAAASCLVSVDRSSVPVESITLNKSSLMLMENGSERLIATVLPEDATDKTVSWSSSNTSVATVDTEGLVKAIQNGNCTITATAGSASASCQVSVDRNIVLVTSVTLDKTELSLKENETARLTATVLPENATDKIQAIPAP